MNILFVLSEAKTAQALALARADYECLPAEVSISPALSRVMKLEERLMLLRNPRFAFKFERCLVVNLALAWKNILHAMRPTHAWPASKLKA